MATLPSIRALLLGLTLFVPRLAAQDPVPETTTPATATKQDAEAVLMQQTLRTLAESVQAKGEEVDAKRRDLAAATDDPARVSLAQELRRLQGELDDARRSFASIALGADVSKLVDGEEQDVDLGAELQRLIEPLIQELKEATEEPRRISALRSELERHDSRARTIERGLNHLRQLRARTDDPAIEAQLATAESDWVARARDARNRADVASAQLRQLLDARRSIVESTGSFIQKFFQSQGFTLLLGVLAFVAVLLGLRLLQRPLERRLLSEQKGGRPFYARLFGVLFLGFAFALAALATLTVFWAAGDWVLLGLALILLFGFAWTSRQALPRFIEQIRLFLNIGSVREGERIVLEGVPYRVDAIRFFSRLVNDELSGGVLRVPIGHLIGSRSRQRGEREPWFPSREGDWVILSDGTRGKVIAQSPEFVQLVLLGGARQTFSTPDFLAAAPRSLSVGFRVSTVFGVDYQHQAICTTEIPAKMRSALQVDLAAMVGEENVVHIGVEFREAGASSLDYEVLADFTGAVAARHDALRRAIQRSLVDACNANGWVIPFTQVTLHQAHD